MSLSFESANEALPHLLGRVMRDGQLVKSRNGDTRELLMQHITLRNPVRGKEITVPGRGVSLPAQIAETMWILAGRNDVEWLSHYLPRAAEFSDDGQTWRGGYGPRLRAWSTPAGPVDQLEYIVYLLTEDPNTRRAVFNIYNPFIDSEPGKDIPCNNWVHFIRRNGKLHAHVAIRSNDLFWGWSGINAFEWTSLLQIVAGLAGQEPGTITFAISSLHLYERHWGKAESIAKEWETSYHEQRKLQPSPEFDFTDGWDGFDDLVSDWFQLESQIRKGGLSTALLHQISTFREPMLRSWLFVLLAWHHDDIQFVEKAYRGTGLALATARSPKRKGSENTVGPTQRMLVVDRTPFTEFVKNLHAEKNAAYGNSWMKRGEMLGIMANCARKVDRLGVGGAGDTAADTAIDLLVYFIKYDLWLTQQKHADWHLTEGQPHVDAVNGYLDMLAREKHLEGSSNEQLIDTIKTSFDDLEQLVTDKWFNRDERVKALIAFTYPLAIRLWAKEQRPADRNATRMWNPEQSDD